MLIVAREIRCHYDADDIADYALMRACVARYAIRVKIMCSRYIDVIIDGVVIDTRCAYIERYARHAAMMPLCNVTVAPRHGLIHSLH